MEAARRAERLGFDGIFLADHFFGLRGRQQPVFEGMVSLAAVASATEHIRVGSLVVRASARPAWTTAHEAWTVQAISGGRLVIGLGISDRRALGEFEAYGIPFREASQRLALVRETIEALHRPELSLPGLERPPVWIGGRSEGVRRLAAEWADGWNQWEGSAEELARSAEQLRRWSDRSLVVSWGGRVRGSPNEAVDRLATYVAAGADELVVALVPFSGEVMEAFAEVVGRLR